MANALEDRPWIWASHVWNMFDFGCAARKEGGVAGRNNKGLVTIDRKTCKDSFYIYRAYWSKAPMIHIAVCRYVQLVGKTTEIKAYSNQDSATLFLNGESVGRSVLIGCSVSKPHWTRAPMTFPEGRYSVRDTMEEIAKNEETFAIIAKAIKLAINVDLKPDMDMWNMIKAITPETAAK